MRIDSKENTRFRKLKCRMWDQPFTKAFYLLTIMALIRPGCTGSHQQRINSVLTAWMPSLL